MKVIFLSLITILLLVSCEGKLDDGKCDITTLNIKGTATVNGDDFCYNDGSLVHDINNDLIILSLRNLGNEDNAFVARFSVPAEGFNFNTPYNGVSGTFVGNVSLNSGTIILESDNYPSDPTLLKYVGSFNLTFAGSGATYSVSGKFSFEKP